MQTTAALHNEAALYQKVADRAAKARETADVQPATEGPATARQDKARGQQKSLHSVAVRRAQAGVQRRQQQDAAPELAEAAPQTAAADEHRDDEPPQRISATPDQAADARHAADGREQMADMRQEGDAQQPEGGTPLEHLAPS